MATPERAGRAGGIAIPAACILGPAQDLLLFVGTPVLIVPLIFLAAQAWPPATLYLAVASFGAVGHHLPGMMRAYGDRALFRRFRVRFVVAPVFLAATCVGLMWLAPSPIKLVLFGWGLWHGFMQAHGIARIYDGKVGSVAPATVRLDLLLLGTWFFTIVLLSPLRLPQLVGFLYDCGVPAIPPQAVAGLRVAACAATAAVTLAFAANAIRCARAGTPPSPLKLALHASTLLFWAFCNLWVGHVLLAILMFEIFHDVQYLAIVWMFNRRRADQDPEAGAFTRFLFRQRGHLVLVYLGLVAGYGSLNLFAGGARDAYGFDGLLGGLLIASTLLHFYFDGFIWKLRDPQTSRTLGIAASGAPAAAAGRRRPPLPGWARHALLWGLFVVPVGGLTAGGVLAEAPMDPVARYRSLVAMAPANGQLHAKLAELLARERDYTGAIETGRSALARLGADPAHAAARATVEANLVTALVRRCLALLAEGDAAAAAPLAREAAALDPQVPVKARRFARRARARGNLASAAAHERLAALVESGDA